MATSATVQTLLNLPLYDNLEKDVGIEIEVESKSTLPIHPPKGWVHKEERSLRHYGIEYVTDGTMSADSQEKLASIRDLIDYLKNSASLLIEDSPRTSVHVHVNVRDYTVLQMWTAAVAYWLLDNVLITYCGEEKRAGNHFCLRLKDAEGVLKYCYRCLSSYKEPFIALTEDIRYGSQNLSAVVTFGSLEYRGMRGTLHAGIINDWSNVLYSIVSKSRQYGTPSRLLDEFYRKGATEFVFSVLPTWFASLHILSQSDWKERVEENALLLCELAYFHSWELYEEQIEKYHKGPLQRSLPRILRQDPIPLFPINVLDLDPFRLRRLNAAVGNNNNDAAFINQGMPIVDQEATE